jgi:hypothetical protein
MITKTLLTRGYSQGGTIGPVSSLTYTVPAGSTIIGLDVYVCALSTGDFSMTTANSSSDPYPRTMISVRLNAGDIYSKKFNMILSPNNQIACTMYVNPGSATADIHLSGEVRT